MDRFTGIPKVLLGLALLCSIAAGQKAGGDIRVPKDYQAPPMTSTATLTTILSDAVRQIVATKPDLKESEIAVTLIDLRETTKWQTGEFRGGERIYPASVVKLFYLAAIERMLEDKQVPASPELERGIRDMIVDSSNEATQYILDVITGTSSGAELPKKQFEKWQFKRNRVNRFLSSLGYTNINANQKTFCEDAYGIEQQSRNYKSENRNALTTNAVARLMAEIVTGRINTPERTASMMTLLSRDWSKASSDTDNQATGFTGRMLIAKNLTATKLWSKAGWTSKARHDAAYIETPDGLKLVLVIFTENHANDRDIIPAIAANILEKLRD
ncbi:MAG TPA: serine hydrolase [Pyrinomonadaceae bacterium]|jgi:hypothetical protein|nr:serine hydrolase [Pyrinomonadaceae bacterium]